MPCILTSSISRGESAVLFATRFFAPLGEYLAQSPHQRSCPKLADQVWLELGVRRALEGHLSGRGFLQHLAADGEEALSCSHFFATLTSQRRLAVVAEVSDTLARATPPMEPDCFACVPEAASFDLYAGDGHCHAAAAHDPHDPDDGTKYAVGHLFMLNYRSHALSHLTVADQVHRKKEHEMRSLKRMDLEALRQGAPKGRKVLIVWDRAGIDFRQWHRWKQSGGLYFLSREKQNMKLATIGLNSWDREDPRNQGVLRDELAATSQGVSVRRVIYHCPLRDEEFSFLTNEATLPPGVIAHLYRLRWEIEKSFDELKNKLGETKAWATSAQAKTMQAHFLCMAHNLMLRCQGQLEREHGVRNEAEITRREERLDKEEKRLAKVGQVVPMLVRAFQRLTVRSVKFIRWLRVQLFGRLHQPPAIDALRHSYAHL